MAAPVPPRAPKPASRKKREHSRLLREFEQDGTLQSPSITLCIELVAKLLYRHILFRDGSPGSRRNMQWEYKFDIDNFLERKYNVILPFNPIQVCSTPYIIKQSKQRSQCYRPSLSHIIKFLTQIFNKLHLNVESSIVSLIYTERLMDKLHISLTPRNWRPIIIAGILTSTKVWDDLSAWNVEFSNLLPMLSLKSINKLEGIYLTALDYDLYISSSEYAKYYFALRGLKNVKCNKIPRYYLDMKITRLSQSQNRNNMNNMNSRNNRNNRNNFGNSARIEQNDSKNLNNVIMDMDISTIDDEKMNSINSMHGIHGMNDINVNKERRESLVSDNMGHSLIGAAANTAVSKDNIDRLQTSLHGAMAQEDEFSVEYQSLRSDYDNSSKLSIVSDPNQYPNQYSNNNQAKLESVYEYKIKESDNANAKGKGKSKSQKIQIRKPKPNNVNVPLLMPLSMPGQKAMNQLKNENRPRV